MSDKNTPTNTQGTRLPPIGQNGAALLSKEYRDAVVNIVNAVRNLEVILPQTDGSNVLPPLKATIDISELSMRIILPPLNTYGAGANGIILQVPLELDPRYLVPVNTVVYVSPQNPLATTGLFDLVINDNVLHTANPGWWIALKNVPAEVVNPAGYAAGTYYNVPAAPPQGATSGTPLKGDMDGANVYWGPWTPTAFC